MGNLKGIVQFTGKLDGISFYEVDGKIIVRKTGGFDGKAIKTQENYVRTRENASEFGRCTVIGKQLRQALASYSQKAKTTTTHSRLASVLTQVMKCDTISERGNRNVALGLVTIEGQQLLRGFEFNPEKNLHGMIAAPYRVLMDEGKITFDNFDVGSITFPVAATHLSLQFLLLYCDFEQDNFTLSEGEKCVLTKSDSINHLELLAPIPEGNGVLIGLVFGAFFQELNGELYGLKECGMRVVGVR